MTDNGNVVFDTKSGISIEEQKEILSQINKIAEKNRKSLSQGATQGVSSGDTQKIAVNAKKSGALFPLAVNIAAAVVLIGGALLLVMFYGKRDEQVRTGGAAYNVTERAVLEGIRKDTAEKIAAKETEIANIATRLDDVDSELMKLYSSNQELTAEQLAAQQRLLAMQSVFRDELAALQEERSNILEDARSKEARLRAQLEERTREFAAAQQRASNELDFAVSELERLTTEQQKIAVVDAQISGALASVSGYVKNSQYEQAEQAVETLRQFLNNNLLSSSRTFQSRREFYNQSVNLMETMIVDARKNSGVQSASGGAEQFEHAAKAAQLEDRVAEMQKTIDAYNSGSSGQMRRIGELEETVASLRGANSALEQTTAEKDRAISSLETENTNLSANVRQLQSANTTQEQVIVNLRDQLTNIRQTLQSLTE
jgi:chromosome segregation ATPase